MRIRKNRLRDDELWDDLKYWLENPITEEEENLRKQAEENYINAVLDKAFGEETSKIEGKEPYLRYEDLLNEDEVERGVETGSATPLKGQAVMSYPQDPYLEIDERDDLTEEEKLSKKELIKQIQTDAKAKNREIDIDKAIKLGKLWGGAALQMAGAVTPFGKIAPAAKVGTAIAKKIAPKVGRKIANEISTGIVDGGLSGAVEGFGRGLIEDENPLKTAAKDAAAGLVLGGAGGAVGGEIAHIKRKKNLDELLDKRKDWGIAFTKQSGKPKEAIDKLLEQKQGFVPKAVNKKGIGDIDFVWGDSKKGLQHIIERREKEGIIGPNFVKDIPDLIDSSNVYKKQEHLDRLYVGNNKRELVIKDNWNSKPRNWLVSAYNIQKKAPSQALTGGRALEQTYASGQQISPLDLVKVPNDVLPQTTAKFNPNLENISKKPSSFDEWLEELKRKRKLKGW